MAQKKSTGRDLAVADRRHTVARMDNLTTWVLDAPVEEVCWRLTEVGDISAWLRAQKAATELRVKAVRLEFIALRKVAAGGLSHKISGVAQLKSAANWLASLTEEEFATVLDEIDGEKSPIALYRADVAQRSAMRTAMTEEDRANWRERMNDWNARYNSDEQQVRRSVTTLLQSILDEGEPFEVAEAADKLADTLGLDLEVRRDTAEGLREMVRTAIRRGDKVQRLSGWNYLPVAFTVQTSEAKYVRVPATAASLGHLAAHAHEVLRRAEASMRHAEDLQVTYTHLLETAGFPEHIWAGMDEDERDLVLQMDLAPLVDRLDWSSAWRDGRDAA